MTKSCCWVFSGHRHNRDTGCPLKNEVSAMMEIQTKRYVTSEEEMVSCARRNNRKLHGRDEPSKMSRISKEEHNVPR